MTRPSASSRVLRCGICLFLCYLLISPIEVTADDSTPWSQDVAPAFLLADSGVKLTPAGGRWSEWYRLGVGKSPEGYTVEKVKFWLTGDRSCGNGAQCREIVRSDKGILWEFRVRGHNNPPTNEPMYSEGHIRVTYRHK